MRGLGSLFILRLLGRFIGDILARGYLVGADVMAKKRKAHSEYKLRDVLPISDKIDLGELKPLAEKLEAKVHGYLDELERMIDDARRSEPAISETQIYMLWAMRRIAFLETIAESKRE
jgi:hypothetical protein